MGEISNLTRQMVSYVELGSLPCEVCRKGQLLKKKAWQVIGWVMNHLCICQKSVSVVDTSKLSKKFKFRKETFLVSNILLSLKKKYINSVKMNAVKA